MVIYSTSRYLDADLSVVKESIMLSMILNRLNRTAQILLAEFQAVHDGIASCSRVGLLKSELKLFGAARRDQQ